MSRIKQFIVLLQFFTTIPIRKNFTLKNEEYGEMLIFAPLIGLIIGGILFLIKKISDIFFISSISSIIIIIFYILLTGGLHIDGLGDTFDGIFSNRPKERILEIMKDSRVGTNAVIAISLIILVYFITLQNIHNAYLIIVFPILGRSSILFSSSISNYARKDGFPKYFIENCKYKELFIGLIFYIILGIIFWKFYLIFIICFISSIILSKYFSSKLNGITGDILGCICELNQVLCLIIATSIV